MSYTTAQLNTLTQIHLTGRSHKANFNTRMAILLLTEHKHDEDDMLRNFVLPEGMALIQDTKMFKLGENLKAKGLKPKRGNYKKSYIPFVGASGNTEAWISATSGSIVAYEYVNGSYEATLVELEK